MLLLRKHNKRETDWGQNGTTTREANVNAPATDGGTGAADSPCGIASVSARARGRSHDRNLRHCVPSGTAFWRSDAQLQRAPILPRTLASCIFGGGWQGRGVKYLSGKAREEACKFLRKLAAAPPTGVH